MIFLYAQNDEQLIIENASVISRTENEAMILVHTVTPELDEFFGEHPENLSFSTALSKIQKTKTYTPPMRTRRTSQGPVLNYFLFLVKLFKRVPCECASISLLNRDLKMAMTGAERAKKFRDDKKEKYTELRIWVPNKKLKKCVKAVESIINVKK